MSAVSSGLISTPGLWSSVAFLDWTTKSGGSRTMLVLTPMFANSIHDRKPDPCLHSGDPLGKARKTMDKASRRSRHAHEARKLENIDSLSYSRYLRLTVLQIVHHGSIRTWITGSPKRDRAQATVRLQLDRPYTSKLHCGDCTRSCRPTIGWADYFG